MDGMVTSISIAGRCIGAGSPCFIIAEAGVNHDGELEKARQLVDEAFRAGADAVKFQTFTADAVAVCGAPMAAYQIATTGREESQWEMLHRLELSPDAHRELAKYSRRRNILFLSTPFDEASADLLDGLGVPAFKVPSGELTNLPLLQHVAEKRKPMIISTGMATLEEVRTAVSTVENSGNRAVVLLHCVSNYPADPSDANLRAMDTMASTFHLPVGYSDHTLGVEVALAAVALGACVIEKHLTLDRSLPGPDHRSSLEPSEFATMVRGIRTVERALGTGNKAPAAVEAAMAAVARRSLVAAKSIRAGNVVTKELVAIKRPGVGLPPSMRDLVLGRRVIRDIPEGTLLTWDMLA